LKPNDKANFGGTLNTVLESRVDNPAVLVMHKTYRTDDLDNKMFASFDCGAISGTSNKTPLRVSGQEEHGQKQGPKQVHGVTWLEVQVGVKR
jgi:hypothetical protein